MSNVAIKYDDLRFKYEYTDIELKSLAEQNFIDPDVLTSYANEQGWEKQICEYDASLESMTDFYTAARRRVTVLDTYTSLANVQDLANLECMVMRRLKDVLVQHELDGSYCVDTLLKASKIINSFKDSNSLLANSNKAALAYDRDRQEIEEDDDTGKEWKIEVVHTTPAGQTIEVD